MHLFDKLIDLTKIPSDSSKKSRPLWLVKRDDRYFVKSYKNVLPQEGTVAAKVCREPYS